MTRTLGDRQGQLRGKTAPPAVCQIWMPEARITMGNEMPLETT